MKSLRRNQRQIWYAHFLGQKPVLDSEGRETAETYSAYSVPAPLACSVSGANGGWAVQPWGGFFPDSDRTLSLTGGNPLAVGDRLWIETSPDSPYNYVVTAVNAGLHDHLIAAKEVPADAP